MSEHGYAPIKLYLQKQTGGWIWPRGHRLTTPALSGSVGGVVQIVNTRRQDTLIQDDLLHKLRHCGCVS